MTIAVTNGPMDVVKRLEPVLRENATLADAERNLPKAAMEAMVEAGIFRTWMPRAFGGLEMAPTPAIQMFEEIARIDSAAGWIASNSCVISTFLSGAARRGSGRDLCRSEQRPRWRLVPPWLRRPGRWRLPRKRAVGVRQRMPARPLADHHGDHHRPRQAPPGA